MSVPFVLFHSIDKSSIIVQMSKLVFTSYESIANSSMKKFVESLKKQDAFKENEHWIVTEKMLATKTTLPS